MLKLELNKSVEIKRGSLVLDRIEHPITSVPGNRSHYFLTFTKDQTKKPFRFDPFNLGHEVQMGEVKFKIFTNSNDSNSLLLEEDK